MARTEDDTALSVLLTFSAELRSTTRVEFQRIIAVLLPVRGDPVEIDAPQRWLQLGTTDVSAEAAWRKLFAGWVPKRQRKAERLATTAMQRELTQFTADYQCRAERELADLQLWLRRTADDLCGAYNPGMEDLFGAVTAVPDWQSVSAPLSRLAAFAADGENPPAQRRAADSAVGLFQRRSAEHQARTTLSAPVLRLIGMLMLVSTAAGA